MAGPKATYRLWLCVSRGRTSTKHVRLIPPKEWFAATGQTGGTGSQDGHQFHRHCLVAYVQAQTSAKQSDAACYAQIQRVYPPLPVMSSSTLNGIVSQESVTDCDLVCAVQFVDGTPRFDDGAGMSAPEIGQPGHDGASKPPTTPQNVIQASHAGQ